MRASPIINMAVGQSTKAKSASKATTTTATTATSSQQRGQRQQRGRQAEVADASPLPNRFVAAFLRFHSLRLVDNPTQPNTQLSSLAFSLLTSSRFSFFFFSLTTGSSLRGCRLTRVCVVEAATRADCGGRSVTRARPFARHASTWGWRASTSGRSGGATTRRGDGTRTTSR